MSNNLHIWTNDYLSDKTNFSSNENILQKKPAESDLHMHAPEEFVYIFFKTF